MADLRRFSESLPMLLLRAREIAMARFRPILKEHGFTEQQWRVLRVLNDSGELTASGLARECSILAPSMTRILKKLANDRYVRVTRSSDDLREVHVSLTALGQRRLQSILPHIEREYAAIRQQMQPERLSRLYEDLDVLVRLEDLPQRGPAGDR